MNLITKLTIFSLMIFMLTNQAYAKKGHDRGGRGFHKILKELDLTKEQKAKLKSMRQEDRAGHKEARAKMKVAREEMKAAFKSDASDSELKKIHEKLKTLRIQGMDKRFDKMLKLRSVLTPEQRKKFDELQEKNRPTRERREED